MSKQCDRREATGQYHPRERMDPGPTTISKLFFDPSVYADGTDTSAQADDTNF
jgi:hypothetical protein